MSQSTTPEWEGYYYALADRIAKLEARLDRGGWPAYDAIEPPAAAGPMPPGYKLAPGWETAWPGYMCHSCGPEHAAVLSADNGYSLCFARAIEMGAIVKVEPPAEQPVGAADAPVPKFDAALKSAKDFLSSVGQHRAGRLVT